MFNKFRKKRKSEEGQSMLEFVIVLPIFMVIMAIILDFGWLFYNQIQLENTARNAARVACVDYADVCLDPGGSCYTSPVRQFTLNSSGEWKQTGVDSDDALTDTEKKILKEVKNTLPSSIRAKKNDSTKTVATVSILYSYDKDYINGDYGEFLPERRYYGDVSVLVEANHHAITPLVAWGSSDKAGTLDRKIQCKSVYKVEKTH